MTRCFAQFGLGLMVLAGSFLVPPVHAEAQAIVSIDLPAPRRGEMLEALRIALSTHSVRESDSLTAEDAPTHSLTVEFPRGMVAPGTLVLREERDGSVSRGHLSHAWDLVDPRAVGVVAAGLLAARGDGSIEAEAAGEAPGSPTDSSLDESADSSDEEETRANSTVHAAEAEPSADAASVEAPQLPARAAMQSTASATPSTASQPDAPAAEASLSCGLCSRFVLQSGWAFTHGSGRTRGSMAQLAFYGRLNDWASVGLRFAGGGGYSSIEGGILDGIVGAPSVMVSHRFGFARSSFGVELGIHTEAAVGLRFTGSEHDEDSVEFGIGVGAFAAFELGRSHGLTVDYSFSTFGLGGTNVRNMGALSLLYSRRWGTP